MVMALAGRKEVALEQKIDGLAAEFKHWIDETEKDKEFEKHNTQIRALTGHLSGLWGQTQAIFEEAKKEGTLLAEARNLESLVLGLRRIWEFFRSKLVQRRDPKMRQFLRVADELSWACYKPVLDLCQLTQRRQPPLVFLNGGLSPYALSRDQAFQAEDVPGEVLTGQTYDPILQHLPIPVIGIPWYQAAHLPDLPVVAHETGHAVEQDFGLHELVLGNLKLKFGEGSPHLGHWEAWSKEVFADLWGCLTLGPAYASSLVDFLAADHSVIENEVATAQGKYPTAHLRVLLCAKALELMEFKERSDALRSEWEAEYKQHAMDDFYKDVTAVTEAILCTTLARPGLTKPLLDIEELRFTAKYLDWAMAGAGEAEQGKLLESVTTITVWTAAARHLYDKSPEAYVRERCDRSLLTFAETLIKPGTRAGEAVTDESTKQEIFKESVQSGAEWFEDFAKWVNAPASVK